jgi:hypothetical protein
MEKDKERGIHHKDKKHGDPAADMEYFHKLELDPENHARDEHELIRYREVYDRARPEDPKELEKWLQELESKPDADRKYDKLSWFYDGRKARV